MARLAMHAAVIGGLSLFGLLVLLSVNSSLKSNIGLSWRGGRRARYLAVNLYYRARNVSMLMTARAMGTAMRHGTPNGTSLRATQGMDSDGSTGAEVEMDFKPMHVNQSGRGATAFGKHNASVVFEGHEGQRFNLARNWKSECAEGKDLPRLHDQPWPMYRLTDSSLGIRPRFPWGSGKGLDEEGFKNGFRFYLYDEGPFNMSGAEDCFRAKWKLPPRGSKEPFEGLDSKMSHENRMYLLELFLWQSIRDHPMRTRDPSEAGLFIIGYTPIMLDWSSPCAEVGDKTTREKEIHAELVKSPHFKRKSGADHLFLWTRYNLKPDKALRGLLDSGPIVAVLERSFFMLQRKWPKAFERGSVVMMPYVSSGFIDTREDTGRKDVGYRARRWVDALQGASSVLSPHMKTGVWSNASISPYKMKCGFFHRLARGVLHALRHTSCVFIAQIFFQGQHEQARGGAGEADIPPVARQDAKRRRLHAPKGQRREGQADSLHQPAQ